MDLAYFVAKYQDLMEEIKNKTPGQDDVDMYYGPLDYATARFNTILLKLSQDRIKEQRYATDVNFCFKAIRDFYKNVQRYRFWPKITRPFIKLILHGIGTKRIPKIKRLLTELDN